MWPNLSPYTCLMVNNQSQATRLLANANALAPPPPRRRAGPRHGVRVVPRGARGSAIAEFDTLAQAREFMNRVLKDHPDWTVELVLIHD